MNRLRIIPPLLLLTACPDPGGGDDGTTEATDAGAEATEATGPVCTDDSFEPNDTQATAAPVNAPFQQTAVLCPGNADFFEFTTTTPGWAAIYVRQEPSAGALDLTLRTSGGGALGTAVTTSRLVPIHKRIPAAGTYAVEVASAGSTEIGYDLNIQFYPEDI